MKRNGNIYIAGKGKLIIRKADGFVMGDKIDLGSSDSIDNYDERDFTPNDIDAFNEKYGIVKPTKQKGG